MKKDKKDKKAVAEAGAKEAKGTATTTGDKGAKPGVGAKTVKGFKKVGKGILVVGNTVYTRTFLVAQVSGLVMMLAGITIVLIMAGKRFGLTNLKPLFTMITGAVFALVGIIMIGVTYTVRWKHRMVDRVTQIEQKWGPARKRTSSLRRAYNINRSAKLRARRSN
jgi:hypothetical protein